MKARVKPIMKEPYLPKVRDVNGEKHRVSREDYRKMKEEKFKQFLEAVDKNMKKDGLSLKDYIKMKENKK